MSTIPAIYENGVFRPMQSVDLEEGKKVEIEIVSSDDADSAYRIPDLARDNGAPDSIDPAADFSDIAIDSGITDLAENIDHYLYGLPKQSEK